MATIKTDRQRTYRREQPDHQQANPEIRACHKSARKIITPAIASSRTVPQLLDAVTEMLLPVEFGRFQIDIGTSWPPTEARTPPGGADGQHVSTSREVLYLVI